MRILSNAHTHSTFCDGKNSIEEMVQEAIKRGFVSIGCSMHGWNPYDSIPATPEAEVLYRQEVRRMREKYRGQIEVILGMEKDFAYERPVNDYEYYIDSVHWFRRGDQLFSADYSAERMRADVENSFGGDYYAYVRCYYENVAAMCARSSAAFIGHIDLITKFNEGYRYFDESDPRCLAPAKEAARCAIERGVPLEMNTGAISRGYRSTPYPNPLLLRFIHDEGGEIIINGDSHSADALETGFDLCVAAARQAGFDHVLRMREGARMEDLPLA